MLVAFNFAVELLLVDKFTTTLLVGFLDKATVNAAVPVVASEPLVTLQPEPNVTFGFIMFTEDVIVNTAVSLSVTVNSFVVVFTPTNSEDELESAVSVNEAFETVGLSIVEFGTVVSVTVL